MQKIILFIAILFSFGACDLNKLEPAQTKAFMKYFGDVGNTQGVDLLILDDGYLLLGNNITSNGLESAILIKTDRNGNQIWSASFDNITGSALAKNDNSYFIVGDSIYSDSDSLLLFTKMSLIKTDLDGATFSSTSLGEDYVRYHGTGITVSSIDEIVVCGYINGLTSGTDTTFLYGYDENLNPSWASTFKWEKANTRRTSSKTLYEDNDNSFVWTSLFSDGITNKIEAIKVKRNDPTALSFEVLSNESSLNNEIGDLNLATGNRSIVVQTATKSNKNTIEVGVYDNNNGVENHAFSIESTDDNYAAGSVIQATDGSIVILGSTDERIESNVNNRSDLDFYLTKVDPNGSVSTVNGFTRIIGGTGNERGAAIVQADDRGFVFIGTMENTNGVELMVLTKVTLNGELIN